MSTKPQVTTFPKTKLLTTVSVAALLFIAIPMLAHASSFGSTAIGDNSTASAIDTTAVGQGRR